MCLVLQLPDESGGEGQVWFNVRPMDKDTAAKPWGHNVSLYRVCRVEFEQIGSLKS